MYYDFGALCPSKSGLMNKYIAKHIVICREIKSAVLVGTRCRVWGSISMGYLVGYFRADDSEGDYRYLCRRFNTGDHRSKPGFTGESASDFSVFIRPIACSLALCQHPGDA